MIIRSEKDVKNLPGGSIKLHKDDTVVIGNISADYAAEAARVIIEHNDHTAFSNQAEVVRLAINRYHWGLGMRGYVVE